MPKVPKGMFLREGRGWYCRVFLDGRERWVALGKDLPVAIQKFHQARGRPKGAVRITVADLAAEWLKTYVQNARSPYNVKQTESKVKRFLNPFLGPKQSSKVGPEDIRRYRIWVEKHELTSTYVHHILADARCLFRWAEDCGRFDRSPFPKRVMPRMQERPPDRLADNEVVKVTGIANPHGFVVRLALGTGLRWGELTRAESSDIQDGVLVVHQTKSGKVRRVPLPPDLLKELRRRIGKLVPFVSSGTFNLRVQELSGVERFHVHQLRHTFACRWLEQGGSLEALRQLLGHSTVRTTERYGRISDDLVRAEAKRVYTVAKTVASAQPLGVESKALQ